MKISVILPTYNEAGHIGRLIDEILEKFKLKKDFEPEIIVIDDNSPDGTAKVVKEKYKEAPYIKCIVRYDQRGLATAIKTGIQNSSGDIILSMDADGNHDPKYIPIFFELIKYYDIVRASRYGWGGGMYVTNFRYWGSYFFNLFIRLILRLKSRDNTSCFMMYRREMLKGVDLEKVFRGFSQWAFTLLYIFKDRNASFIEVPVYYPHRYGGVSKTKFLNYVFQYLGRAAKLRFCGAKFFLYEKEE